MWLIKIIVYRIWIVGITSSQLLVDIFFFQTVLDKIGNNITMFITPGILPAPMVIEVVLYSFHLLLNSFFRIFLHTRIQRSIDF